MLGVTVRDPRKHALRCQLVGRVILGHALGITPREGKKQDRVDEKSSCDAVSIGASVDPTEICEDRMTLQSCPKLE